jgi:hypothetical protein
MQEKSNMVNPVSSVAHTPEVQHPQSTVKEAQPKAQPEAPAAQAYTVSLSSKAVTPAESPYHKG